MLLDEQQFIVNSFVNLHPVFISNSNEYVPSLGTGTINLPLLLVIMLIPSLIVFMVPPANTKASWPSHCKVGSGKSTRGVCRVCVLIQTLSSPIFT